MLTRSLGAPIGTGIGIVLYIGITIAIAMYILSAVEVFIITTGLKINDDFMTSMRVYGVILLFIAVFINIVGLKYVVKADFVFLIIVILGILSIYIGCFT